MSVRRFLSTLTHCTQLDDKCWLEQAYLTDKKSAKVIACELNCFIGHVYQALARFDMPTRSGRKRNPNSYKLTLLERTCEICQETFNPHALQRFCKVCVPTREAWYVANAYGLTWAAYQTLFARANGCCEICKQPEKAGRRLAVDHCHVTKKVRGLLCIRCNTSLGVLDSYPDFVKNAQQYLELS